MNKREVVFEWGHYIKFIKRKDGTIDKLCIGARGHINFKPSFAHKMKLILRILFQ